MQPYLKSARSTIVLPLLLAGIGWTPLAGADSTPIAVFKSVAAQFPKNCARTVLGMSGLCVIASTSPKPRNRFLLSAADRAGQPVGQAQPVTFNAFMRLQPGQYLLYSENGMDSLHEFKVTIYPGAITPMRTATVKFNGGSKANRLQHYQSSPGIDGRGCSATRITRGTLAVLPGNYQVTLTDKPDPNPAPRCLNSGVTFNVLAGTALAAVARKVSDQQPSLGHGFTHPDGVSSLASISSFAADIQRLSLLPHWKSVHGIHNPHVKAYPALILSGIGTRRFLFPFTWRPKKRDCGVSLAKGGLPAKTLMTACVFQGRNLTGFRVNPGNYYTLNNRHGKTAIEANYINNPILVSGLHIPPLGGK